MRWALLWFFVAIVAGLFAAVAGFLATILAHP